MNAHIDDGTSQPVVMDHLNCIGDEKTIFDCMYWPEEEITCDHRQDVVISCHNGMLTGVLSVLSCWEYSCFIKCERYKLSHSSTWKL